MKIPSATATAIVVVILLCALSTGGQQQSEKGQQQTPGFIPVAPKRKAPGTREDARPVAHLPDGRVVRFPAEWDERGNPVSTSQEEIDALAKSIAAGAVELPPGVKVIGWEPVEGTNSLLPEFEQRVATVTTTKGKLEALANAAGILQTQISVMKTDIQYAHARIGIEEKSSDGLAKVINENANATTGNAVMLRDYADQLDHQLRDLKRELDDFKEAACPVLRRAAKGPRRSWDDVAGAMADQNIQMRLDTACGLH